MSAAPLRVERVTAVIDQIETVATQLRTGLLGMRVGVPSESWTAKELRALEERAMHMEMVLGRFRAEWTGTPYIEPILDWADERPPSVTN